MGWRGKLTGGTIGFFIAGPLGAIVGAVLGSFFDRDGKAIVICPHCRRKVQITGRGSQTCPYCRKNFIYGNVRTDRITEQEKGQSVFFIATFSMLAKLAQADGTVTPDEMKVINDFMRYNLALDSKSMQLAQGIFNEARSSRYTFEDFARQFHTIFRYNEDVLRTMIELLLKVAMADGHFHPNEERMILSAVNIFNMSEDEYKRIRAQYIEDVDKYYAILNCSKSDSIEEIKKRYRKLALDYHPDRIISKGLPEEFIKFANKKFQAIQEAYEKVSAERNFS